MKHGLALMLVGLTTDCGSGAADTGSGTRPRTAPAGAVTGRVRPRRVVTPKKPPCSVARGVLGRIPCEAGVTAYPDAVEALAQAALRGHARARKALATLLDQWVREAGTGDQRPYLKRWLRSAALHLMPTPERRRAWRRSDSRLGGRPWAKPTLAPVVRSGQGASHVAVASAGLRMISARAYARRAQLWKLPAGELVAELPAPKGAIMGDVRAVAMNARGTLAAVGSQGRIEVWRLGGSKGPRIARRLKVGKYGSERVTDLAFGDNGLLVAGLWVKKVAVWDLRSGKVQRSLDHIKPIQRVAVGRSGSHTIVVATAGGELRAWRLATGKLLWKQTPHRYLSALRVDPEGQRVATTGPRGTLVVYDLKSGRLLRTLRGAGGYVNSIELAPGGRKAKVLAAADHKAFVWGPRSDTPGRVLSHGDSVRRVRLVNRGKLLMTADRVVRLRSWPGLSRIRTHRSLAVGPFSKPRALAFGPRLGRLAVGTRRLTLWDLKAGRPLSFSPRPGKAPPRIPVARHVPARLRRLVSLLHNLGRGPGISAVRFGHGGRTLVFSRRNGQVVALDLEAYKVRWRKVASRRPISTVDIHQNRLLTGGYGRVIKLWNLKTGKLLRALRPQKGDIDAARFGPRGRQIFSSGDHDLWFWNATSGRLQRKVVVYRKEKGAYMRAIKKAHKADISAVAFDPRGVLLASASRADRLIKLWDLSTGSLLVSLVTSDSGEWAAFTPDGWVDGSVQGRRILQWRTDQRLHSYRYGWGRRHVPGLVGRLLTTNQSFRLSTLRRLLVHR